MSDEPFMEHPTGEHANAIDAMEAAIFRLRALPEWNRWITFCAQGAGTSPETVHFAEVRLLSDVLETGTPVDVAQISAYAKVPRRAFAEAGKTRYSLTVATPREAAQILDALFRCQFGIALSLTRVKTMLWEPSGKPGTDASGKPGTSMISKSQGETEVSQHLGAPEAR